MQLKQNLEHISTIGRELFSVCAIAFMLRIMNYIQGMPCLMLRIVVYAGGT